MRLSPHSHAIADYLIVGFLLLAPFLFALDGLASAVCWSVATGLLLLALLTAYPLGTARRIHLSSHGGIDGVLAVALAALPWILGLHDPAARAVFVAVGVAIGFVTLSTDYRLEDREALTHDLPADRMHPGVSFSR